MKVGRLLTGSEPLTEREEVLLDILGELIVRNNQRAAEGKATEFMSAAVLGQWPRDEEGKRFNAAKERR